MQRVHKALASAANSGKLKSLEEQTKGEQQFGHPQICRLYAIMVKLVSRSCVAGDFRANRRAFEAGGGLPFRVANLAAWSFCSKLLNFSEKRLHESTLWRTECGYFGQQRHNGHSPLFTSVFTTAIHYGHPQRLSNTANTAIHYGSQPRPSSGSIHQSSSVKSLHHGPSDRRHAASRPTITIKKSNLKGERGAESELMPRSTACNILFEITGKHRNYGNCFGCTLKV